jgi:alpha-L-rhamnosidase
MKARNAVQTIFPAATWLWSHSSNRDERDRRVQFRRTFELDTVPEHTEIKITADSYYTLWVNGQYVNRGPARGFQRHWPFDRINLAPYLKVGKNVIAVMAYQYGISNFSYTYESASGFLLSGHIETLNLGTGPEWKYREAPGYLRAIARASGQYCFQEFFDCRSGDDGWRELDYDDQKWEMIGRIQQRVVGCMPWHSFEERAIPLLTNDLIKPEKLIAISRHKAATNWQALENIGQIYNRETTTWQATSGAAETVIFEPGITAQLVDFGKEVVGLLNFEIDCAEDKEILDFMVCESISGNVPDFPNFEAINPTLFGGRIILKQGLNRHELTMPWGFRYLVLLRRDASRIKVKTSLRQTVYPLEVTGVFNSSDERLNSIWHISEHTQRCCMVDAYIDCPWRENAQWWGDALVQAKNNFRLSNDTRLFERGLRQIATQKTPNGLTYGMAPTSGHGCILPDYSAMWIVTLFAHYWQTGKPSMWLELCGTVDGILNYFEEQIADDGLLYFDKRYWLFLDWSPELHKNGASTVLNLIYLWALQSACQMAKVTNDNERLERYVISIERLTAAITRKLYNPETKLLYDGLTFDGEAVTTSSPHVAALAIITDLFPESHEFWLEQILLPLLCGNRTEKLLPSSYFMYYIFEAVKSKGYTREVINCVSRWWGEFVDNDCSTTPENWLDKIGKGIESRCHAWSAHPLVQFSEIILGVRQLDSGWSKVSFEPLLTKGQKASGSIPTPHGLISVDWDWTEAEAIKNIQLPSGVQLIS